MPSSHLNKKLAELLESGDVLGFKTMLKKVLTEELDDQLPDAIDAIPLGSLTPDTPPLDPGSDPDKDGDNDTTPDATGAHEAACLDQIRKSAVAAGGDEGYYDGGVLDLSIPSLSGAKEFAAFLDAFDAVESYEIEGLSFDENGDILPGEDHDLADIQDGQYEAFEFYVYLDPDLVVEDPVILNDGEEVDEDNGTLTEMKRVIRVKFGSGNRAKMQCHPGYKFDHAGNRCVKLTEEEQVNVHKSHKRTRIAAKAVSGMSHRQISKKSFKNSKARKKFGSGR